MPYDHGVIPDEIALAFRLHLGIAQPAELSDLVDRRIATTDRVDSILLELATPGALAAEDIAARLVTLSSLSPPVIGRAYVVLADRYVREGRVSIDRAVAFLEAQVELPRPYGSDIGMLADTLYFARSGTYGTEDDARTALRHLAARCADHAPS